MTAGVVGRPHGLDGSFVVQAARGELLREGVRVSVAGRTAPVVRRSGTDARPIVRLEACDHREAARRLGGLRLLVAPEQTPELAPDEWWAEELEGCRVVDEERSIGVVRRLVGLPSCEALEVARDDGGELLVPLVADAVREVDVERRRIDVRLAFVEPPQH